MDKSRVRCAIQNDGQSHCCHCQHHFIPIFKHQSLPAFDNYILDVFEMLCKLMHIMYVAADMTPDQKPHILAAWQSVLTNDIQGLEARTF